MSKTSISDVSSHPLIRQTSPSLKEDFFFHKAVYVKGPKYIYWKKQQQVNETFNLAGEDI